MGLVNSEKESVALGSVFASGGMAIMKLVVGLLTGSIGILSEAAHSLLDLGAAGLTYFAVRVSDKPADADHPYGHAKIESVSALIETGLLFLTSIWIVKEAADRLLTNEVHVEFSWYAIAVIVGSIIIDFFRARALSRVAKETKSQALEADALHFSSDILSSGVVLLGLAMVYFGFQKADALAALGVAVFVCRAGYQLGRRTLDILIDTAPEGVAERVVALASKVPGIAEVERVRVRPAGKTIFIEILASVGRTLPLVRVQEASHNAARRVRDEYPDADIVVHTQPLALDNETIADRVKLIAANHGLSAFRIAIQRVGEQLCVTFDLEVPAHQSIREAHDVATLLENAVRDELGADVMIDSHIAPLLSDRTVETTLEDAPDLVATIEEEGRATPFLVDVHNIQIRRSATGRYVSFHCRFQDDTPLEQVEGAVRRLEHRLYDRIAGARRVVAHAEPIWHED